VLDPADLARGHGLQRVEQAALGSFGRVGRERRPALGQLDVHEAVIAPSPGATDEPAVVQAVDEDRGAALMHGERGGEPAGRHAAVVLQRLERPQLGPGQAIGVADVLGIGLQRLHDAAQALDDVHRVSALGRPTGHGPLGDLLVSILISICIPLPAAGQAFPLRVQY